MRLSGDVFWAGSVHGREMMTMIKTRFMAALRIATVALVGSSLLAVSSANAQTWNGSVNNLWDTDANWSVAPVNGNSLTFSGTANQVNTNDAGITSIGTLTLSNPGWDIDLGASAVAINSGITATGSSTLTGNLTMSNTPRTITLNGVGTTLTLDGDLNLNRANNTNVLNVFGSGNILELSTLTLSNANNADRRVINNTADVVINAILNGGGNNGLIKNGGGTLTLQGSAAYTLATSIYGGTFDLGGGTADGSLASADLNLGSATFNYTRTGANTQSFTTTTLTGPSTTTIPGGSIINVAAGNTLNLGNLVRGNRGSVEFGATGTITTTTGNDANGILGGWATIGGNWAVSNGGSSAITGYTGSYDATSVLGDVPASYAGGMISVDNNQTLAGVIAPSTLNFRTAGANTLTLAAGTNTVDGIMVTSDVGANASVISGGDLSSTVASGSLNTTQNNTASTLTINSNVVNNTSNTAFVKSGAGELMMVGAINSTGGITINGGTLRLGNGTSGGGVANQTIVNNGQLVIDRGNTATNLVNHPIHGTGGVLFNAGATGNELTLNTGNTYSGGFTQNGGNVAGIGAGTYAGFGTGTVTVNSVGNNGWRISGTGSNAVFNNQMVWNAADMKLYTQISGVDATATWNGPVTLGNDINVVQASSQTSQISHVFNGNIGESGGNRSLTFSGGDGITRSPVFTLNGVNTYTGNTTTTNPLSTLIIGGSGTLGSGNYAGAITAAGNFTYSSSATQTLSNASNAISGNTTVAAGTLYVTGGLSSTAITVENGGAIGSNGANGTLSGNLTIASGGILDLTGASLGFTSTGILSLSSGNLTLDNLTFQDLVGWDWLNAAPGTYELIDGTFDIDFGSTAFLDPGTAYNFGNGKSGYFTQGSLNVVIVPEPAALGLFAAGGALGLGLLRRRQKMG
jgi:autotransporter-associated beta strand protein